MQFLPNHVEHVFSGVSGASTKSILELLVDPSTNHGQQVEKSHHPICFQCKLAILGWPEFVGRRIQIERILGNFNFILKELPLIVVRAQPSLPTMPKSLQNDHFSKLSPMKLERQESESLLL